MVDAADPALHVAEEPFDGLRVDMATRVHLVGVADRECAGCVMCRERYPAHSSV